MRKAINRCSQLDRLLPASLEKWGCKIKEEGGHWHYNNTIEHIQEGMFAFCFITEFQKEVNYLIIYLFYI